ncbi:lysosomal acid phosphatase [Anoplophora glabripennis]|uniref:lysosomal acid phosphatase n=1 Tax=Anoplophora glabripennis TaxID=217634 RepID=UPI000873A6A7|nr:lysosomal acid phosphatase [Anoplophora glabripennis]
MENKYLIILVNLIFIVSGAASEEDTLLSVVQAFRHGERTPVLFYLTDPYKDSSYWDGLSTGQLTNYGKIQLMELGKYFRDRYDGFVSSSYSEDEIYVRTVSGKRNLLSAEAFLAGLYPDEEVDMKVHQAPIAVVGNLQDCLRYDIEWLELEATNEYFKKINEDNSEDYKYIRENSLFPVYGLETAYGIWDTLHIEKRFNYTLPEWTDSVFPEKLTKMSDIYAQSLCYDENLQKLGAGGFINALIDHFDSILTSDPSQKIQLYSVHDTNIACFLNAFDAFSEPHIPDFASSLIFELRQDSKGSYVNSYYKPANEAVPINLRGCAFDCRIEDFRTLFSNIKLSEIEWVEKCYTPL